MRSSKGQSKGSWDGQSRKRKKKRKRKERNKKKEIIRRKKIRRKINQERWRYKR